MISKPVQGTFPSYYQHYLDKVPADVFPYLQNQLEKYIDFIAQIPKDKFDFRYEENKWTIKEVMLHLNDTERVFGYRAFCISRNENQDLPGFDQVNYIKNAPVMHLVEQNLLSEFEHLRKSNLAMFEQIRSIQWENMGMANKFKVPLKLFPFIMAGHVDHHLDILVTRYLA